MNSIGEYDVRRMTEDSISDVVSLLQASYPDERYSLAQRVAKFDTEYFGYLGVKNVGYLAYHGGAPAAFYGLFPCRMRWRGRTILGAQSGDTVTHPSHRRRGLFFHLAEKTYDLAGTLGISILYGLPNPDAYPGFLKLNWQTPFRMQIRVARTPTLRRLNKLLPSALRRAMFTDAQIIDPSDVDFKNANNQRGELFVERSTEFLRYKRYNDNCVMRFRSGDAWISIRSDGLFVGDAWPSSGEGAALWHDIIDYGQALGLPRVYYHTTPNLSVHGMRGTLGTGLPVIVKNLRESEVDLSAIAITGADYDTF
jgi:GNAT superfamily N-acetyltransferase